MARVKGRGILEGRRRGGVHRATHAEAAAVGGGDEREEEEVGEHDSENSARAREDASAGGAELALRAGGGGGRVPADAQEEIRSSHSHRVAEVLNPAESRHAQQRELARRSE